MDDEIWKYHSNFETKCQWPFASLQIITPLMDMTT
jgi:hypothetical protein